MARVHELLKKVAAAESALRHTRFLSPCIPKGQVRTRINRLVYTFTPTQSDYEGWGIFKPINEKQAEVVDDASLHLISEYLQLLPLLRVRLAFSLSRQTWLAYPTNDAEAHQRFHIEQPIPIHLVSEGTQFEQVLVRGDGSTWWFEDIDRRADPRLTDYLREELRKVTPVLNLRQSGLTPEMRVVYELATQREHSFKKITQQQRDEKRLRQALRLGGGELEEFQDRGDFWLVEWMTRTGEYHSSAISKNDLTVVSAGICLSGRDQDFDLQSLVGVVEQNN